MINYSNPIGNQSDYTTMEQCKQIYDPCDLKSIKNPNTAQ